MQWCVDQRCFCPADGDAPVDLRANVAPYVSAPGSDGHGPGAPGAFLRVAPDPRHGRPVLSRVAAQLQGLRGKPLRMYCHMGAEQSVYELALQELTGITVSLSGLLGGVSIYDTAKHVRRLGLEGVLPGLAEPREARPDVFLRGFTWMGPDRATASEGYGAHWAALLLLGALMGTNDIHAATSAQVARTVVSLLLQMAPRAATLGRYFSVSSFNSMAERAELVVVPAGPQPEHFLRPLVDYPFIKKGVLSVAPGEGALLPEDVMHLSAERKLRRLLKCAPDEATPPRAVSHYQVVLDRHYCAIRRVWRPRTAPEPDEEVDEVGTLIVRSSGATLQYGATTEELTPCAWLARVKELGFVLQPLVTRAGAAWSRSREVGCLVPTGARASAQAAGVGEGPRVYIGNFDFVRRGYHVLFNPGDVRFVDQREAIRHLVAPGTVVWVPPATAAWAALAPRFPPRTRDGFDDRVVKARINVPTGLAPEEGKLYVAVEVRAAGGRADLAEPYQVFTVDPWDLVAEGEDGYEEVIEHILP